MRRRRRPLLRKMLAVLSNSLASGRSAFRIIDILLPHDLDKVPEKAINAMVVDEETEELLAQQVKYLTYA